MMSRLSLGFLLLVRRGVLPFGLAWLAVASLPVQAATYAFRAETFAYDTPSASANTVTWHTTSNAPSCTQYPNGDDDWADVAFATSAQIC